MDIFFVEAIVAELKERMPHGARIDKVHQPSGGTLILRLWSGREELRLLICAEPGKGRLHLTKAAPLNPGAPPRFCQLLRARLVRITAIEQPAGERIVRLSCRGTQGEDYVLVAELFGSPPNLLLLTEGETIVDVLHRKSGGRDLQPHSTYLPPSPRRLHPLGAGDFLLPPETAQPPFFERWLLEHLTPMSPLVARALAAAVAAGASPDEALAAFRRLWRAGEYRPGIALLGGKRDLLPFALPHLSWEKVREYPSASEAADSFYEDWTGQGGGKEEIGEGIRRALQRLRARERKIAADREGLPRKESGRKFGELILGNIHRIRPGAAEITVDDWYADPPAPLSIPLDPALTAQENAEKHFRSYKKGKKGEEHVERRLRETGEEIAWLEEAELALGEAESGEDLEAIRRELEEGGLRMPGGFSPPKRRNPDIRELLRRGSTPAGFEIVWGKNSRTNDFVSRQLAAHDDLWFHAHRLPGCHLVLRRGGRDVPEEEILFAAAVAAGYSRGRDDGKVEVMVSEGRWVRKPKGARPGLVTVEKFRTVVVRPRRLEEGGR